MLLLLWPLFTSTLPIHMLTMTSSDIPCEYVFTSSSYTKTTHFHFHLCLQNSLAPVQNWANKASYQPDLTTSGLPVNISPCLHPVIGPPAFPSLLTMATIQCHCVQLVPVSLVSQSPDQPTFISEILSHSISILSQFISHFRFL